MRKICSLFPMLIVADGTVVIGWLWWHRFFLFGKKRHKTVSLVIEGDHVSGNESETDSFLHKSVVDDDRFFSKLSQNKDI